MSPDDRRCAVFVIALVMIGLSASYWLALLGEPQSVWMWRHLGILD